MAANRKGKNKKITIISVAVIVIVALLIIYGTNGWDKIYEDAGVAVSDNSQTEKENTLTASFIDVGQGDCSLFISDGFTMLIDAGERQYSDEVIDFIRSKGITTLDYVVATHGHSDHIGGMADILNTFETKNIILSQSSDGTMTSSTYEKFIDAADSCGANIIMAEPDYTFSLGEASCKILSPLKVDSSEENNNSVVMYVSFGETSFLMTGDAEKAVEEQIEEAYPNLKADILKVGHHGSKTSTSEPFLKLLSPETAVISVGEGNSYGHPSDSTVNLLESFGIKYYRTDLCGTVTVTCTTDSYTVSSEK